MPLTKDQILQRLRTVNDPELHRDVVTLNLVKHAAVCDGVVSVTLAPSNPSADVAHKLRAEAEAAIRQLGDEVKQVDIRFEQPKQPVGQPAGPQEQAKANNPLPGVKHIIAVGAGKGGVGKSTIAVNLAVGLARAGHRVGLMDGDIYGPSIPTMLGVDKLEPQAHGNMIVPFDVHGVFAVTIGALVEDDKPLIWRGPMAHGAFRQLATQTEWGELDHLIIDLPPGTGDVPLTMSQLLPLSGAVIVCTPQKVAQDDAVRALRMFQQLGVEVLGVVENMSYFIGDDQVEYDIFGRGGAEMMAQQQGAPFLGAVPINTALRRNADAGDPTANFTGNDKLAEELDRLVARFLQQLSAAEMSGTLQQPTLNIT